MWYIALPIMVITHLTTTACDHDEKLATQTALKLKK